MPSSYRAQPEIQDDLNGNNQVEAPIDAVRIATDILDAFLSAKTLEDKQLVYDNLARYTPDQLCRIEEELKTMKKIEMGKVDLLLLKLDILEGEILEMMPEYPVSKKIAVIINGDNIEDKHIENVKSAIKTLQGIGFDEIFVAHSGNLEEFQGIIQFDGTKSGVDKLFSQLDPSLQKDALVFLYTTGHGDGGAERESTIYLQGDNLRQSELLEYLKPIKNKGARLIASFDQCYSGNFPKAIINSGIEGIALSPGVEGVETACQFFAPYFFAALSEGRDMNNDGLTTIQEAFFAAMAIYNTSLGIQEHGEIARSTTELTEENYEKMMRSGKATVIEIGATWCGPCKLFAQEVHEVWGMVGEQVNFLTITMDQFPEESDSLIAKMKVEKPKRIPTVYITTDGGATFMPFVGRESSDIAMELKNVAGIEVNNDFLINKIHEAVPSKTREEITEMVEYGITSIDVIALMMNDFELFKKAMPSYSNPYFSTQDKAMLYLSKVSPETANGYAERFNIYVIAGFVGEGISPEQANGYAERFDVYDIVKLVKAGISNEEVLKYDKSFLSYDIVELVKAGISSE
ncbi:MAG: thioredoxin family protein, partial [Candidatus Gracilibacteria bacterium]|nr:thioredoxin family protein [Candidatus Gracilibacteria bacterium]